MLRSLLTLAGFGLLGVGPAWAQQEVIVEVDLASVPALANLPMNPEQFKTDLKTELAKLLNDKLRYWEFKPGVNGSSLPKITVKFEFIGSRGTRGVVATLLLIDLSGNEDAIGPFGIIPADGSLQNSMDHGAEKVLETLREKFKNALQEHNNRDECWKRVGHKVPVGVGAVHLIPSASTSPMPPVEAALPLKWEPFKHCSNSKFLIYCGTTRGRATFYCKGNGIDFSVGGVAMVRVTYNAWQQPGAVASEGIPPFPLDVTLERVHVHFDQVPDHSPVLSRDVATLSPPPSP